MEQARVLAQEWLAEVRRGDDPGAAKAATRKAPTMKEFCHILMEDYSKQRNKPSTQRGYGNHPLFNCFQKWRWAAKAD